MDMMMVKSRWIDGKFRLAYKLSLFNPHKRFVGVDFFVCMVFVAELFFVEEAGFCCGVGFCWGLLS